MSEQDARRVWHRLRYGGWLALGLMLFTDALIAYAILTAPSGEPWWSWLPVVVPLIALTHLPSLMVIEADLEHSYTHA